MTQSDNTQDVESLRREIEKLREEITNLGSSNAKTNRDFAQEIQEELRNTLNQARDKGQDVLNKARASGDQAIDQLEKQIGERPLLTLLLVFIVGLVMAKLFERR